MYHLLHYTFITFGDVITKIEKAACLVFNVVGVLVLLIALALCCSVHVTPPPCPKNQDSFYILDQ